MRPLLPACLLVTSLTACGGAGQRELPAPTPIASPFLPEQEPLPTSPLRAELTLSATTIHSVDQLDVYVKIVNGGDTPVRLYTGFFPMPSVALELVDEKGQRVAPGPPPVPPKDDGVVNRKELGPGGSLSLYYGGGRLMGGPFPGPGKYWLRFALQQTKGEKGTDWEGEIRSAWVGFRVEPAEKGSR